VIADRPTLCTLCKHFDKDSASPVTCAAFPDGIPGEFWEGYVSHMRPTRGEDVAFEGAIPFGYESLVPDSGAEDDDTEPDAAPWVPTKTEW
jgi:hypothetical protein